MEPLTMGTTLAVLIGLLRAFKQERGEAKGQSAREFMDWLENHRHQELKSLILTTHGLSDEIDRILQQDHREMLAKLDRIDEMLASLTAHVQGLSGITSALRPQGELSDQAIGILEWFVKTGAGTFFVNWHEGGVDLQSDNGATMDVGEARFLDDDIGRLLEYGLVLNEEMENLAAYKITRGAVRYVGMIQKTRPMDRGTGEPKQQ